MSDEHVHVALRSDASLVVIEAPAGCGKTHQGSEYAKDIALRPHPGRPLILTHTHAACSVFSERTKGSSKVEIRTIDSLVAQIAGAYHAGLGLPPNIPAWIRQGDGTHQELASRVASLLRRHPMIAASLARRHPIVICDEHQDSSVDQHSLVMALYEQGATVRIFGDPMQSIFSGRGSSATYDWDALTGQAQVFERLSTPHRWATGCPQLGQWILKAREVLRTGGRIDLRASIPPSVVIVCAENQSQRNFDYQLSSGDRRQVDSFEQGQPSLLVLTHYNQTARSLRSFFNRRIALWEGHTREALDNLVKKIGGVTCETAAMAAAIVDFMGEVGKGFSPSAFGNAFQQEVAHGCTASRRGKPAKIQCLARLLLEEPNHRGVAKVLRGIFDLSRNDAYFAAVEIDCLSEFWDAIRLSEYDEVDTGLSQLTNRRTYSRPAPPTRALSTIHKAKGLECERVIVLPCDAKTFPDKPETRRLLYVALSRARRNLMLVVSRANPSPLFLF